MEDITAPIHFLLLSVFFLLTAYLPQNGREKGAASSAERYGWMLQIALAIAVVGLGLYRYPYGGAIELPIGEPAALMLTFGAGTLMVIASLMMLNKRFVLTAKEDITPPAHPSRTPPAP